jgi:hypothetical protein
LSKWLHRYSAQRLSAYGEKNADAPPWEITDTIQLFSAPSNNQLQVACYLQGSNTAEKICCFHCSTFF